MLPMEYGLLNLLDFLNGNGVELTDLNTALTTQTLVFIYGFSLAFNQFVNIHGTDVRAFPIAGAFVVVHSYLPHVVVSSLLVTYVTI
jgi:hypothetical protein